MLIDREYELLNKNDLKISKLKASIEETEKLVTKN